MSDPCDTPSLPLNKGNFKIGFILFGLLFSLSLFLQFNSGAWGSDFGKHADEGAHVVTSLMVRDYIAGGWIETWHPLRFAEKYYEQFPKVAIGHYPPGFYLLAGLFLLPSRSPESLLILMCLLSALVGWQTWRIGKQFGLSDFFAISAGVLVCLFPLTRTYTSIVMADMLLVAFSLFALNAWSQFREMPSSQRGLAFGLWAAAAILTKGSAIFLGLLPPIAILLGKNWGLMKDFRLWLAPLPVLLFAFPWYFFTRKITAEGMQQIDSIAYIIDATPFYFLGLLAELSWIVFVPALCLGLVGVFDSWKRRDRADGRVIDFAAYIIGSVGVVCLVPTGLDHRYLLPVFAPAFLMAFRLMCDWVVSKKGKWGLFAAPCLVLLVLIFIWRPVEKRYIGASQSIETISNLSQGASSVRMLIVSDAKGEGALTASAAFNGKDQFHVLRGTKLLAGSDWMGRGYVSRVENRTALQEILRLKEIEFIILEQLPEQAEVSRHWEQCAGYLAVTTDEPLAERVVVVKSERSRGKGSSFIIYQVSQTISRAQRSNEIEL